MELPHSFNLDDSRNAILNEGFLIVQDQRLGANIQKMEDDIVPFASVRGFQFCKDNVLDNPGIRPVLETFFKWSCLGLYRSIGPAVGDYTLGSDPNSSVEVLLVQLWSKESEVVYWAGSHHHWLAPIIAENSLLRVPRARLNQLSLKPTKILFKNGGFAIVDGRTAFETLKGTAITFAFGTEAKVKNWRPMILPKSEDIEKMVAEMKSESLGMNVTYIDERRSD